MLEYMQLAEQVRQNVVVIGSEMLRADWYREQIRLRYGPRSIAAESVFKQFEPVSSVIEDKLSRPSPVYLTGTIAEEFEKNFTIIPQGVVLHVSPRDFK